MLANFPLPLLVLIFLCAAAIIWVAGIHLSKTTDILASRWGLGEALGGLIMLAIVTNLPEIAITISGALSGNLHIVTGNILGGIAIQTVVLVVLDFKCGQHGLPLSYKSASLNLVLEALLVLGILTLAVMGTQLPKDLVIGRFAPAGILIALMWIIGLWLIGKSQHDLPWHGDGTAPNAQPETKGHSKHKKNKKAQKKNIRTTFTLSVFIGCAIATLICGIALEKSGSLIADQIGMNGIVFGAVVLAAATALPELSTGITSIQLNDYKLAVSDIFGGNAFLPVLFLFATLISGNAVLPTAGNTDIYLAGLGMLLTTIYSVGLIFRPKQKIIGIGIDSFVVLILYIIGILGLIAIAA